MNPSWSIGHVLQGASFPWEKVAFVTRRMPTATLIGQSSGEQEICARAVAGDKDAVLSLYRAHHAHVRAFARRLLGDEALAEDLVQEVFLDLGKALGRFRNDCPLRSYIVAMAAHRARHHLRTLARRRRAEARLSSEPRALCPAPDRELLRQEMAHMLAHALGELPYDQRVAFVLCEVEERSSVEVAKMLGAKDSTIRARVFHAKKKLRESMKGLLGDGTDARWEAT